MPLVGRTSTFLSVIRLDHSAWPPRALASRRATRVRRGCHCLFDISSVFAVRWEARMRATWTRWPAMRPSPKLIAIVMRAREAGAAAQRCIEAQTNLFALNARAKASIAASFRRPRLWSDSRSNPKRSAKVYSPLIPNVNRYRRCMSYDAGQLCQDTDRPLQCQPYRRRERSPFPLRADRRTISRWRPTQPARAQEWPTRMRRR